MGVELDGMLLTFNRFCLSVAENSRMNKMRTLQIKTTKSSGTTNFACAPLAPLLRQYPQVTLSKSYGKPPWLANNITVSKVLLLVKGISK